MNKFNVAYISFFMAFSNVEYGMDRANNANSLSDYSIINSDQVSEDEREDSFSSSKTVLYKKNKIIASNQDAYNTITDGFVSKEQTFEKENAQLKDKLKQHIFLAKSALFNNKSLNNAKMKEMLQKNCEELKIKLTEKDNKITSLGKDIGNLLNEKGQLQNNCNVILQYVNSLENNLNLKNEENTKLCNHIVKLIDNMSELSKKQNNKNKMYEYRIAQLQSLRIQERQEKNKIQAQCLKYTVQNKSMQDTIAQLKNDSNSQLQYINLLKNDIEKRKETAEAGNNRVIEMQDQINLYQAKYESIKDGDTRKKQQNAILLGKFEEERVCLENKINAQLKAYELQKIQKEIKKLSGQCNLL